MTIPELISRPIDFRWMMLNRLEFDIDAASGRLWGITMEHHMEVYNALCESLDIAPRR